jgi:hypothetical protein
MPQSRGTNVVIPTSYCTLLSSIWDIAYFFADPRYPQFSSTKMRQKCFMSLNSLSSLSF